jgi:hypothetical protein
MKTSLKLKINLIRPYYDLQIYPTAPVPVELLHIYTAPVPALASPDPVPAPMIANRLLKKPTKVLHTGWVIFPLNLYN